MGRKVYIDCGANLGQGYERFKSTGLLNDIEEVFMFEPLPNAYDFLCKKYKDATIINKAVWVNNEKKVFSVEKAVIDNVTDVGHASTLLGEDHKKNDQRFMWENITVDCIDLNNFIVSNFLEEDTIFLKLDVEGAEYAILDRLIEANTLRLIKTLHIEFHGHLLNKQINSDEYYMVKIKEVVSNVIS